ncbi:MAG: D-tyrosyl-tRNA(Tyr) deacylase [Clostridia bacterium]|nr:D-tyrosyl-tRNA(Tyr) deacylase [Clostridia bacterium]
MRAVVQRVNFASVTVNGEVISQIDKGLLVFLGINKEDTKEVAEKLARKVAGIRIFSDANDKMSLSVSDVGGKILLVSNFTLYGNVKHGYRPEFLRSAGAAVAEPLYEYVMSLINNTVECKGGAFGEDMLVVAHNDGPVTVIVDTDEM